MSLTLPTFTPAIRTGEFFRIEFEDLNTACIWNGRDSGLSFVKPKYTRTAAMTSTMTPTDRAFAPVRSLRSRLSSLFLRKRIGVRGLVDLRLLGARALVARHRADHLAAADVRLVRR